MVRMKKPIAALIAVVLLLMPLSVYAADTAKMKVDMNQTRVKVNGYLVTQNIIQIEGAPYASLRTMSDVFKIPLNYHSKMNIFYLGELPRDIESDREIEEWRQDQTASEKKVEAIEKKGQRSIEAELNAVQVYVQGTQINGTRMTYNGRTYIPFRSVAQSLKLEYKYDANTVTAYIGSIPDSVKNPPKKAKTKKTKMYDVAGNGEFKGWRKLKGHPYEGSFDIYFTYDGKILSAHTVDIRKIDLKKKVQWVDDKGRKRTNTVKEIYTIFSEFSNQYTSNWLYSKFGDLYADWLMIHSVESEKLVEEYLIAIGKMEEPKSNIMLTPDAILVPAD